MADNTTLNAGTGGDIIASDDVAGVKYQRVKVTTGADGVAGGDVTATNPLDVRIGDATNTASVKAASTAAAATDKALVVAISPNNTIGVTGAFSTETTLSAMSAKLPATLGQKAMAASQAVVVASDQSALPVTAPTLTKGTQAANGFSTQHLKDAGRVYVNFNALAVTAVTAEALITTTPYRDLVAGGAGTTFAVTAGKKLRLQTMIVTVRATSTVNVGGVVRLRMLAGTVLVASPVHASVGCMSSNLATAVVGNALTYHIDLPDGLELSGTMQLGLTQLFSAATATIDVQLIGFEY